MTIKFKFKEKDVAETADALEGLGIIDEEASRRMKSQWKSLSGKTVDGDAILDGEELEQVRFALLLGVFGLAEGGWGRAEAPERER